MKLSDKVNAIIDRMVLEGDDLVALGRNDITQSITYEIAPYGLDNEYPIQDVRAAIATGPWADSFPITVRKYYREQAQIARAHGMISDEAYFTRLANSLGSN